MIKNIDEAKRLAGSRKMDRDSFEQEILTALENAEQKGAEKANGVIVRAANLIKALLERHIPHEEEVRAINGFFNDYLGSK